MSQESRFAELLEALREATAQGRVRWQETADETMFRTTLGDGMIRIARHHYADADDHEQMGFTATLLDRDGAIADEIEVRDGAGFRAFQELYEMARRSARNADRLLDSMLKALNGAKAGKA